MAQIEEAGILWLILGNVWIILICAICGYARVSEIRDDFRMIVRELGKHTKGGADG